MASPACRLLVLSVCSQVPMSLPLFFPFKSIAVSRPAPPASPHKPEQATACHAESDTDWHLPSGHSPTSKSRGNPQENDRGPPTSPPRTQPQSRVGVGGWARGHPFRGFSRPATKARTRAYPAEESSIRGEMSLITTKRLSASPFPSYSRAPPSCPLPINGQPDNSRADLQLPRPPIDQLNFFKAVT